MSVSLCFDFGNTRKKVAVFNNDQLSKVLVLEDDASATIESLVNTYKPKKTILSSVINHNTEIEKILGEHSKFHVLNYKTVLPVTTPVGKPETIGADRLALAAGGIHFYPGKHLLIVGLGTCITLNFVNKYKELIGGSISPGLKMRLKALQYYTAKLPLITPKADLPLIGYDTETNILSGVILGMAYELDGFVDAYTARYDNLTVLISGGDTGYMVSHMKNNVIADPDLLFKGLYAISEVNNP